MGLQSRARVCRGQPPGCEDGVQRVQGEHWMMENSGEHCSYLGNSLHASDRRKDGLDWKDKMMLRTHQLVIINATKHVGRLRGL